MALVLRVSCVRRPSLPAVEEELHGEELNPGRVFAGGGVL